MVRSKRGTASVSIRRLCSHPSYANRHRSHNGARAVRPCRFAGPCPSPIQPCSNSTGQLPTLHRMPMCRPAGARLTVDNNDAHLRRSCQPRCLPPRARTGLKRRSGLSRIEARQVRASPPMARHTGVDAEFGRHRRQGPRASQLNWQITGGRAASWAHVRTFPGPEGDGNTSNRTTIPSGHRRLSGCHASVHIDRDPARLGMLGLRNADPQHPLVEFGIDAIGIQLTAQGERAPIP